MPSRIPPSGDDIPLDDVNGIMVFNCSCVHVAVLVFVVAAVACCSSLWIV